ncbi:uncharacterized protein LOC107042055 [Diachasma alloeum]|uniref:uncharacterized protein LOC107042055 n=1 Tax=Diachasma alloeum TaxID=454923 RepID=UPI0007383F46|nr:uncharacterized protein LOC107042055 [Diachasma alloeum]XP_015118413.1 uncharacterized protein LOC107042055 [Diachasma alloeum]
MCLPQAFVIVIVKSRDDRGARFKHINVREESTMVAWLPQQILLLLILVTAETTYVSEKTVKWSIPSGRRNEKSSTLGSRVSSRQKEQRSVTTTSSDFPQAMPTRVSRTNIRIDRFTPIDDEHKTSSDRLSMSRFQISQTTLESNRGSRGQNFNVKRYEIARNADNQIEPKISNSNSLQSIGGQLVKMETVRAQLTSIGGFPSTAKPGDQPDDSTMRESPWSVPAESLKLKPREPIPTVKVNSQMAVKMHFNMGLRDIVSVSNAYPQNPPVTKTHVESDSHPVNTIGHFAKTQNSLDSSIDSLQFQFEPDQDQVTPVRSTGTVPVEVREKESNVEELLNRHSDKLSLSHSAHGYRDRLHRGNHDSTTVSTTAIGFRRRYMRDTTEGSCEKFEIGEERRQEFYSPNYPQNYPASIDCIRVLDAGEGMVLKLDFRDRFDLEAAKDKEDCKYDFLEVRDGLYGYATQVGLFCGKSFPPEITSKGRYLWLHFHSDDTIQYSGFKAIWTTIPRPTAPGVPPEAEPCIKYVTHKYEAMINTTEIEEERAVAQKNALPLDCLWIVEAKPQWTMQLNFDSFKLDKPNDCDANFMSVFDGRTEMTALLKNFCGSIAEAVSTKTSTMFIRFYMEPKAINSTFKALMTAVRAKEDKPCMDDEYDCDDATCIAWDLRCNKRQNCRLGWDEDDSICGKGKSLALDSTRIVIILVIFGLIMFGLTFVFLFNCIRKLIRDHRIIREHIRQSRENRLDEIGRKSTPCPISVSQTDLRQHGSDSPSLEIDSNKELIPTATIIAHEYTKDLVLEMTYNTKDIIDIHQSNNVSNATQERLQETSEEPQMCDSSCQTRESLFDPRIPEPAAPSPVFSTFGYSSVSGSRNGVHPSIRQSSRSQTYNSPKHNHGSTSKHSSVCSSCSPASRGRDTSGTICPRHAPIPAPPGWSIHDPPYAAVIPTHPEDPEYLTYQRYQSPKPERDAKFYQPAIVKQRTIGSGEKYGSFLYGSERSSTNTTSNTNTNSSQHSGTPRCQASDPRYRAEAIIEVDQKRPFSIESTKSAPDVIATH